MRTEVRTVPKLEYIALPTETTERCLVPMPPLNAQGELTYEVLPPYVAEVLGILEECNIKLETIKGLQPEERDGE